MEKSQKMVVVVVMLTVAIVLLCGSLSNAMDLCNMSQDELKTCKPSVTKPNPVDPSKECCTALAKADLGCLCSYKNSMLLPSMGINPDLAMQLPAKCNLTPPATC